MISQKILRYQNWVFDETPYIMKTYETENSGKNKKFDFAFNIMFFNIEYLSTYFQNESNIDKMLKLFSSSKA